MNGDEMRSKIHAEIVAIAAERQRVTTETTGESMTTYDMTESDAATLAARALLREELAQAEADYSVSFTEQLDRQREIRAQLGALPLIPLAGFKVHVDATFVVHAPDEDTARAVLERGLQSIGHVRSRAMTFGFEQVGGISPVVILEDGVPTCPACGGTKFRYDEGVETWRSQNDEETGDGRLVFFGETDEGDGDDNPGVVCEGCGNELFPGEAEVDWT